MSLEDRDFIHCWPNAAKKLAEIERRLNNHIQGSTSELLKPIKKLEKKLNRHIEAMSELRLNHRMIQIEEKLDDLDKSLSGFLLVAGKRMKASEERLDELSEAFYGGGLDKEFLDRMSKLEEKSKGISPLYAHIRRHQGMIMEDRKRLRKLEDLQETLATKP